MDQRDSTGSNHSQVSFNESRRVTWSSSRPARSNLNSPHGSSADERRTLTSSSHLSRVGSDARSTRSTRSLSFVSINKSINTDQLDNLREVEGNESVESSFTESNDHLYPYKVPKVCCSCMRITPKRFRTASVFRKFPWNFCLAIVYFLFFFLGTVEQGCFLLLFNSLNSYSQLNPPETTAAHMFAISLVHLLYPVMGFLADTLFGRYRVMMTCLHLSWLGSAVMAVAFTKIDPYFTEVAHTDPDYDWPPLSIMAMFFGYIFVTAGLTGIRVNLIPFGVDQIPDASSGELSSYFHWIYWCYSAGYLCAISILPSIYIHSSLSYVFTAINFAISMMIILLLVFQTNLQISTKTGNPLSHIYKVLSFAAKTPKPLLTSAFQRGQQPPPWIDRAMLHYGGKFTVEEVEDVKTFFRILLILLSFFGYYMVKAHIQTTTIQQGFRMQPYLASYDCPPAAIRKLRYNSNSSFNCNYQHVPPEVTFGIGNLLTILVLIPLFDRFIYTCLNGWKVLSMFGRITVGQIFLLFSIFTGLFVEVYRFLERNNPQSPPNVNAIPFHTESSLVLHVATPISGSLILPQYFLFAFAEVFASITMIELIYAQSPANMKGILLGFMFGTEGVSMGIAGVLILLLNYSPKLSMYAYFGNVNTYYQNITQNRCRMSQDLECFDNAIASFVIFSLVALSSIIFFAVAAVKYKYRKRDLDPYLPIWLIPSTEKEESNICQRLFRMCYS